MDPQAVAVALQDPALATLAPEAWTFNPVSGDLTHTSGYGVMLYGAHGRWYPCTPKGILLKNGRRVGYKTPSKAVAVLMAAGFC